MPAYTTHFDNLSVSDPSGPLPLRDVPADVVLSRAVGAKILTLAYHDDNDAKQSRLVIGTDRGDLVMWHDRDCCRAVYLDDGFSDLTDLIDHTIASADARGASDGSYEIRTGEGGSVALRWYGAPFGGCTGDIEVDWLDREDAP